MAQRITRTLGVLVLTGLSGLVTAQTMNWSLAGPLYNAGRARNMIVDRLNSQILYVGSASSGIFKSTSGGARWAPVNDQATIRNISYLAQSFDGTIYAGTGEGFLSAGQKTKAQAGTGLYKLDQSTSNLVQVVSSSIVGTIINRVACNPNLPTHIALATNLGIFTTTDGSNFTLATLPGAPTGSTVSGHDVKFDGNGILYCSFGSEVSPTVASTLTPGSKVYKASGVSMSSFTDITPTSTSLPDLNYGRIELAVAPSNNNIIYASCAGKYVSAVPNSSFLKGLFVSYDAGATWGLIVQGSAQLDPLSFNGNFAVGAYSHIITVDPSDANLLYFGGFSFYTFKRTGGSDASPIGKWILFGAPYFGGQAYLHENIHDIKVIPGTPSKYFFITDAGVYRSIDLNPTNENVDFSYQAYYRGMVTGQFNSVSIERFPISSAATATAQGAAVAPYAGFVGGTAGNGLTYFSGRDSLVTSEFSYLGGEVYSTEYSKILSDAVLTTRGNGTFYRSANIKTSSPTLVNLNKYGGGLSTISPDPEAFSNNGYNTSGTPFKLWENYGQIQNTPDDAYFYNDTIRALASFTSVTELSTASTFTFLAIRPNKYAVIDSIAIKTATIQLPINGKEKITIPFTTAQDLNFNISNSFVPTGTLSVITGTNLDKFTGPVSTSVQPTVTLNSVSLNDNISVTFAAPPFANKTQTSATSDYSAYYRVFATIYYTYKPGDVVTVEDNNISTRKTVYSGVLTDSLNWRFGAQPTYTLSVASNTVNSTIPSPTYVLKPGNTTTNVPTFYVTPNSPGGTITYTITNSGTYTLSGAPFSNTFVAVTTTAITSPTYVLNPGNVTQTTAVFIVTTTTSNDYTITATGTGTAPAENTMSTSVLPTYSISGSVGTQTNASFIVSPTVNVAYVITGTSSNTVIAKNNTISHQTKVTSATFVVGAGTLPLAKYNQPVKIKTIISARLAMIMNNQAVTGGANAIVVSKNPLALNDPLSFVRVSQSKAYMDDANGAPTTSVITITGKPIVLEWSKGGREIYYATSDNKVYRVSHINEIMDLSPSSFSGKFYTDIFKYSATINDVANNPVSPYRTTLIGSFDRPVTSISVSNDDKKVLLTFNGAITGTTNVVMYNTNDASKSDISNISWVNKQGAFPSSITYCSMMEKDNNSKVFVGTDNGLYYTSDITSTTPDWKNVNDLATANNKLPNIQIFDIKQQTLEPWNTYNSGQIYIATNGRGVWSNSTFFKPFVVGTEEYEKAAVTESNLRMYPNPTNAAVNLVFKGMEGENAIVNVSDISGRLVKTVDLGKLESTEATYSIETSDLQSGVYIVNVTGSSGARRVGKLVVTK